MKREIRPTQCAIAAVAATAAAPLSRPASPLRNTTRSLHDRPRGEASESVGMSVSGAARAPWVDLAQLAARCLTPRQM